MIEQDQDIWYQIYNDCLSSISILLNQERHVLPEFGLKIQS